MAHTCTGPDGVAITCLCSTGRDHGEDEMDLDPVTDTVADRNDVITGMAGGESEILGE